MLSRSLGVKRSFRDVPTKEAIMTVISASSKKYATIFKVLMETGVMPFELVKCHFERHRLRQRNAYS